MRLHKFKLYVKVTVRRLSNPVFFMLLALSLCLWYITKLSYVYTTDIQIPVRIDSTLYSVRCNVEGVGYQILKHKIAPRRNGVDISSDNVAVTPSARQAGVYDIAPFTLPEHHSSHISDLKILSVEFARRDRISSARA